MRFRHLIECMIIIVLFVNLAGIPLLSGVWSTRPELIRLLSTPPYGRCQWSSASSTMITCGIYPTDDASVDDLLPSQVVENNVMKVQDIPSVPISKNYAFLRFDFSTILPSAIIASGAKPLNATLWLYNLYTNGFQNASVRAYHVASNDWNEDSLTWNNMPGIDTSHYTAQHVTTNNRWYNWSVTADVQNITRSSVVSFAMKAGFTSWANYAIFAAEEDASERPELDVSFQVPALNIQSLPNLPVMIDGRIMKTDAGGGLHAFLPWGLHNVSIPESLPVSEGVRMSFVNWSDNVESATRQINIGNNVTLRVNYQTQYRLDVISEYAVTSGSGWYFQNETATASVEPTAVFAEGLPGLLGVRHVFDHWVGGCVSDGATCSEIMNEPKQVTAVWRDDYTVSLAFATSIAVVLAITALLRHRRKSTDQQTR